MLRTVRLYGELGRKFGKVHKFHVESVGGAIRALCANFKGFKQYLIDTKIAGYEVWDGKHSVEATDESIHKVGDGDIKIIPKIKGGSAAARIIIGVVLIIVSWWMGGAAGWAYLGAQGYAAATMVFSFGASMILGGVMQAMSSSAAGSSSFTEAEDSSSYIFSGPINTTRQGNPVFIGYGEMIVGSQVVSTSLTTSDI